jgi:hypothetical protein
VQASGHLEHLASGKLFQVGGLKPLEGRKRFLGAMEQSPDEGPLGRLGLTQIRHFLRRHRHAAGHGCLTDFGPYHLFRDLRSVSDSVGKLVSSRCVGNPRGYGEHLSEELPPVLVVAEIEAGGCLINQVL